MAAPGKVGGEWTGEAWFGGGSIKGRAEVRDCVFNSITQSSFL